jgi:hypothetical protein
MWLVGGDLVDLDRGLGQRLGVWLRHGGGPVGRLGKALALGLQGWI